MHKVTIALATFAAFWGCDVGRPTSPSAAKSTEAAVEPCPMPILGIAGTWARSDSYRVYCPDCEDGGLFDSDWEYVGTADTLRIAFAPDPNPAGEPGVTYYDYTLFSYYSPSAEDALALADLELPSLFFEQRGTMGVYYADGGRWAFHYTVAYQRYWKDDTKQYLEGGPYSPSWGHGIKMFDGWLVLEGWDWWTGWDIDDGYYQRVAE